MKRNLAIQILCPLFLLIGAGNICQAQELEGKFRIRWRLNNIPDSVRGVMYVFNPTMTASKAIADFPLQNGEMIYEDTISQPKHLKFFGWAKDFPNWTLDLWVDRGGWIDIQGKDKWLHQWMITTNIPQQKEALSYAACTADETDECLQMDEKCQVHDSLFWDRWHKLNYRSVRKTFEYMKTTPVTEVWIDQFLEKPGIQPKIRIHCAVFVLFSSSCMHVCRPNGRKRRKENSLSHMPSLLRLWKKETIWLMVYYMTLKENPVIYQNCKADTSCWISGVSTAALAACLNRKWKRLSIYMAIN